MPGGVCANLDYEVEMMAEYVSEMATRLVLPQKSVNPAFRKFVSQILTSTRLPRTTILLGMNYLAKHINTLRGSGQTTHTEGQVWRMVTVALLLGSKFLDDNTFQNKSWAEVSGIPVQELNVLEYEWLGVVDWQLFVNLDQSHDYKAWLANWQEWLENKKTQQAQANRERLAALVPPIDTDVVRSRHSIAYSAWHQQQVAEYERLSSLKRSQHAPNVSYRREQPAWAFSNPWQSGPLTPPDSGYGTPENSNSATSIAAHYNEWFDRAITTNSALQRSHQQPSGLNFYPHNGRSSRAHSAYPSFFNYTNHSIWEPSHMSACSCGPCSDVSHKQQSYFMTQGYGQPVAG